MPNKADTCRKMDPLLRMQAAYDISEPWTEKGTC